MAPTVGAQVDSPLQPPADVNAGDHSEAMLHKLDDFKKLMAPDRLGFLYERWRGHPCADPGRREQWKTQPVYGQGWQEKEDNSSGGLWQLKIINWGLMWGALGRLNNLHTSAEGLQTAADQVFQKIHGAWTSKAGDAAAGKFTDLRNAARDYATELQTLAAQMEGARRATRHAVEQLADFPNKGDVAGKPIFDRYGADGKGDDNGNESRGQWSRRIDEMDRALRNGTARWGIYAHEVYDDGESQGIDGRVQQTGETVRWPGQVYLTDGDNMWADQACHWLDDMTHCYFLTIGSFRRRIEETLNEVKTNWDSLNSKSVALLGDPFGKLSLAAAPPPDDGKDKDKDGKDKGKDTPGSSGNGHPGTSSGNGHPGTGSTGVQQPPPIQQPPLTQPQPEPQPTTPSQTEPIDDPTGQLPDPKEPGQDPTQNGRGQETVTIQDGEKKISVQSPDGQGHVKVTVDDGTGHPKTYDMDFGAGTGQQPQPGQPGGPPQTLPAPVESGTDPTGGTQPVEHVQAGPDGKVMVHDGDLTITAEHPPGAPDQVKITIDDGTGEPTTYLVDYSDPTNAHATPQQPQTAGQHGFAGNGEQLGNQAEPAVGVNQGAGPAHALANEGFAGTGHAEPAGFPGFDQPAMDAASAWTEPPQTTTTQSVGFDFGGEDSGMGSVWSTQGDLFSGDDQDQIAPAAGEAGLAAVPDDGPGQHAPSAAASSGMAGMPMMGGMGAAGGGEDQERGASSWSTQGDLFDDGPVTAAERISSVLGDD